MTVSDSQIQRYKYELGYNIIDIGGSPYISYVSIFDTVIQQYINSEVETTSSTAVTAATSPTVVTLTLASATGMSAGDTVIIDVDSRRERCTIRSISGSTITVILSKAHSGTYPVKLESGETIASDIVEKLDKVHAQIESAIGTAGIKKIDEIEFATASFKDSESQLDSLKAMRMYWRDELASALGVANMHRVMAAQRGGSCTELY